mgnify:CR=1 FL=1
MIGQSKPMQEIFDLICDLAPMDSTVLITGETGTGKGLAAKAIHTNSSRRNGPFVTVNCGAIPDALIDSELFGHEKGAFTGAIKQTPGKIESADGGTDSSRERNRALVGDLAVHVLDVDDHGIDEAPLTRLK